MRVHSTGIAIVAGMALWLPTARAQDHHRHPSHPSASPRAEGGVAEPSPYAGQEERAIKSLSDEEVEGYLQGHGVGMARPAELNHYPGPRHVLDLAAPLGLSPAQIPAAQGVFEQMRAAVLPLGERYVTQERRLDELFGRSEVEAESLRAVLDEAARVQAELRFAHLRAHLAMRALLTPQQVARYDELRGY
jgi:hypothetical protein